jgi:hypothetical protein
MLSWTNNCVFFILFKHFFASVGWMQLITYTVYLVTLYGFSVENQMQFATTQLNKLKQVNIFNSTFHIWYDTDLFSVYLWIFYFFLLFCFLLFYHITRTATVSTDYLSNTKTDKCFVIKLLKKSQGTLFLSLTTKKVCKILS